MALARGNGATAVEAIGGAKRIVDPQYDALREIYKRVLIKFPDDLTLEILAGKDPAKYATLMAAVARAISYRRPLIILNPNEMSDSQLEDEIARLEALGIGGGGVVEGLEGDSDEQE